jgi:hypothetical protein
VGTVQYMRLEHDGHLRLYEWRSNAQGWAPVFNVLLSKLIAISKYCLQIYWLHMFFS